MTDSNIIFGVLTIVCLLLGGFGLYKHIEGFGWFLLLAFLFAGGIVVTMK